MKKLEAALSDTSKFGMAKSLVMRGREAGFDMESIGLPSPRPPSRAAEKAAARKKQDQRKAARKARKRNR